MGSSFEIIDVRELSPDAKLLRAAKAALADHFNVDGSWESTDTAMSDLREAIRQVEMAPGHNGWITWGGGPCPVSFDTVVDISRAGGGIETGVVAGHYTWGHHEISADRDITAFRVVSGAIENSTNSKDAP